MKIKKILNLIENMTLLELNELLENIKIKYNLNSSDSSMKSEKKEEENIKIKSYKINLINFGKNKISVIKLVKEINNLGLKETKDLVESCPVLIKDNLTIDNCNSLKERFENIGAEIKIIEND